jgi:hypothetical protein
VCFAIDSDHGIVSPVGRELHAACSAMGSYQKSATEIYGKAVVPLAPAAIPVHQPVGHHYVALPQHQPHQQQHYRQPSGGGYPPQPYAPYQGPASPPQGGYIAPAPVPMSGGYSQLKTSD